MIAVPPVNIVISAAISDPVASVAMNESILMTTTTTPLTTPITTPAPRPRSTAGTRGTPAVKKWAVITPVNVIV